MRRYNYLAIPFEAALAYYGVKDSSQPDAYMTMDDNKAALQMAQEEGYRWVRTDGHYAIFEKEVTRG